jgi:hypothetical protein
LLKKQLKEHEKICAIFNGILRVDNYVLSPKTMNCWVGVRCLKNYIGTSTCQNKVQAFTPPMPIGVGEVTMDDGTKLYLPIQWTMIEIKSEKTQENME